jgi:superfamily II helicase
MNGPPIDINSDGTLNLTIHSTIYGSREHDKLCRVCVDRKTMESFARKYDVGYKSFYINDPCGGDIQYIANVEKSGNDGTLFFKLMIYDEVGNPKFKKILEELNEYEMIKSFKL